MRRVIKIVAATSVAALMLAACGSSGGSSTGTGDLPQPLRLDDDRQGRHRLRHRRPRRPVVQRLRSGRPRPQASPRLGLTFKELSASPTGETDATRQERLVQLAEAGYNPIIAVGFAYAGRARQGGPGLPGHQLRDHRRRVLSKSANVAEPDLRRGAGLLPRRRRSRRRPRRPATSASSVASTSR